MENSGAIKVDIPATRTKYTGGRIVSSQQDISNIGRTDWRLLASSSLAFVQNEESLDYVVSLTFWFIRNRFVGSYSFFSSTNRS